MSKRSILLFSLLVALLIGIAFVPQTTSAEGCVTPNQILNPEPFQWTYVASPEPHYVGVMEYGEATFDINGQSLTTRAYRQEGGSYSIPGPTMNMVPGNKYVLRFRNLLPFEAPNSVHNDFKDPNITNVHTHGLHVSGESPGDDVTRMFEGGFGGDYVYDIPADHMGGTFWYHAHHHGSTFLQVSTGGFGFIIIDDSQDGIPASVAAMEERHVLIGYLDPSVAGAGGDSLVSGTLQAGWTVNGKVNGNLCVPPDTWQHWRVLLADRDAKTKDVIVGDSCEVKLLARDGVWRTSAPKDLPARTVNLTGASRADLAVRCSADSDIKVGSSTVANIVVAGTADSGPHPFADDGTSMWSAARPSYLRDLRGETRVNSERINMGARTVNGNKFDISTPTMTLNADSVQEWSLKGAGNHPFHLHVYHFQAMADCGGDFEYGEYYDTMASNCGIRFDLNAATSSPYSGRTIMHCHILEHEDQGAMGWVNVIGGTAPPTFPDTGLYSEYYPLSTEPPTPTPTPTPILPPASPTNLLAQSPTSSTIDLFWTDNADNEGGFEIERSVDGVSFASVATVGVNVSSYVDTGLTPESSYWYRVLAFNAGGSSAYSNIASASTTAAGSPSAITVGSIVVTTANVGQGAKQGQAIVTVLDDLGGLVSGATVTGDFSGSFNEPGLSAVSDAAGTAIIETQGSKKGSVSLTFCVTSITHPNLADWAGSVCVSN